eukprot:366245-Chlamydomonas_euryale.AAC.25
MCWLCGPRISSLRVVTAAAPSPAQCYRACLTFWGLTSRAAKCGQRCTRAAGRKAMQLGGQRCCRRLGSWRPTSTRPGTPSWRSFWDKSSSVDGADVWMPLHMTLDRTAQTAAIIARGRAEDCL